MQIAGVVKNSFVDYPKHIACVVFTAGCNMNCWYCHNRDIITMKEGTIDSQKVLDFLKKRIGFLDGVVISGGEPTLQPNLKTFITNVKGMGYKVKLDTNGTNCDVVKSLVNDGLLDYIAMDIKAPLDRYEKVSYVPDKEEVKRTIKYIQECGVDYEFRTTFAPNLTREDVIDIVKSIEGSKRYALQAYIKPSYIKEGVFTSHKEELFYDIMNECKHLVQNFILRNL